MNKTTIDNTINLLGLDLVIPYFSRYKNRKFVRGMFDPDDIDIYFTENGQINILKLKTLIDLHIKDIKKLGLLIDRNDYYLPGVIAIISYCLSNKIELFMIYKDNLDYTIQSINSKGWN